MPGPDRDFWQRRFLQQQTPWDRAAPGLQIAAWVADGTVHTGMRIAVPGCGSGQDVLALAQAGCDVTAVDYADAAIALTQQRLDAQGQSAHLVQADVLTWQPTSPLDAVYEQTCWCALHPDHWAAYAAQLHVWLRPGGSLLLMAMQCRRDSAGQGRIDGPPYHMDINAVRALLPEPQWAWPTLPYAAVPHPAGWTELAIVLRRK